MEYFWLVEDNSETGKIALTDTLVLDGRIEKSLSVAVIAMYKNGVPVDKLGLIIPPIRQSEYAQALRALSLPLPVKTTLKMEYESFSLVQVDSEAWNSAGRAG